MVNPRYTPKGGCLLKALFILAIVSVALAAVFWFVVKPRLAGWVADAGRKVLTQAARELHLPADQQTLITQDIDRLAEDYKVGRITHQQLSNILDEVTRSPLVQMAMVYVIQRHYTDKSGLSEAEKQEVNMAVQRFARGLAEGTIPREAIDRIQAPVFTTNEDGDETLKPSLTDQELLALSKELKAKADAAQVPNEPFNVDIAREFHKAIERGLDKSLSE